MDCANFCRLCAEFRSNQQLTPLDDPDRCIRTKLFRCSQINLPLNDSLLLPQSVCDECIEKLEQSWSFANAVTEAQNKLQSIFAEDPLADIKIKEEIVTNSPCQLLDDHDYTDIREIETADRNYTENTVSMQCGMPKLQTTEEPMVKLESDMREREDSVCGTKDNMFAACRRGKELWLKVMEQFRRTFNITDEDCDNDGTINEKAHPELSQHSWRAYNLRCSKCLDHFNYVDELQSHARNCHSTNASETEYCCFDCDKKYAFWGSLKTHIFSDHRAVLKFW